MYLSEKVDEINEILKRLGNASGIVVWGGGVHTAHLFEKTDILDYPIKHIVDIDEKKQKKHYFGFTIQNPDQIEWKCVDAVVVSVPGREKEIEEILVKRYEYSGDVVTFYDNGKTTPFYRLYDMNDNRITYTGDYDGWQEAERDCNGYDDRSILDVVAGAIEKVIDGTAAWERDSYLFYEQKYNHHLCAAILKCAIQNEVAGKEVRILDIGGSLGSGYFQNRGYLREIKKLEYTVAEQDHFAEYGNDKLKNETLKFIKSTEHWEIGKKYDIILMSASLQYIENYKEIVAKVRKAAPRYIILDRIFVSNRMRICKETVPEWIYRSSYPVYFFTEDQILKFFGSEYELVEQDIASVPETVYFEDGASNTKYYVFKNIHQIVGEEYIIK